MRECRTCHKEKSLSEFSHRGSSNQCKPCAAAYSRAWAAKNRDKVRERDRKRWKKRRTETLMRKYGITQEDYEEMFEAQGQACAICLNNRPGHNGWGKYDNLHVDHDPEAGKVRGLLCFNCNTGIGQLQHDVERMERAVQYLR